MLIPKKGEIMGIAGPSKTGKTVLLKFFQCALVPNYGRYESQPGWPEVVRSLRGEAKSYFNQVYLEDLKTLTKIQQIEQVQKAPKTSALIVGDKLMRADTKKYFDYAVSMMELQDCLLKRVSELTASELQRFLIALTCVQEAEVYLFDEPFAHLDLPQRAKACRLIASLKDADVAIICVDNDMCALDYLCDSLCCTYGVSGVYGAVSMPGPTKKALLQY